MAQNIHDPDVFKSQKETYDTPEIFCETDDFMPP